MISGAYSLPKNDSDGHALEPTLAQVEIVLGYRPAVAIGDKGFRGKTHCVTTEIVAPNRSPLTLHSFKDKGGRTVSRRSLTQGEKTLV